MKQIIYLIIALIMINLVSGLGIGPAKTNIIFEPGLENNYSINIYNTDNKAFRITVELQGELSNYIKIKSSSIQFSQEEKSKQLIFTVLFPRAIPPGSYKGKLRILELPVNNNKTITATVAVTHDIFLEVPKHGKYIRETIEEKQDFLEINIENIGLETIKELNITNKLKTIYQETINNFQPDQIKTINIALPINKGEYENELFIQYDELNKSLTKKVIIGNIEVEILNLTMNNFTLGEINKIIIPLKLDWNKEVPTFLEVEIKFNNEIIETIKTNTINLQGIKNTILFWDTKNLKEGSYSLNINSIVNQKINSNKEFVLELTKEKLFVKEKIKIELKQILLIGIILLIIILVLIIFRRIIHK